MLFTGGRVLVAVVGAVVLVAAAVVIVRSIWWDTSAPDQPVLVGPPPASSSSALSGAPAAEPGGLPAMAGSSAGQPAPADTGGGAGATTSTETSTETTMTEGAEPYTAGTEHVQRILGTVAVDVELPQVRGGKPEVAQEFNDGMDAALQEQATSLSATTLQSGSGSGTHIGSQVLSGVLRTVAEDLPGGTSTQLVSTVVVDTASGRTLTLDSLFGDLSDGLAALRKLALRHGSESTAGASFDGSGLQPTEESFEHWTAQPDGMHLFIAEGLVAPAAQGVVEVTVPWADLDEVLKPGVREVVAG